MSISSETAHRVLEASKQRAQELRSPVSIAIVDAGGHLVLFERMMAPFGYVTADMSIAKASTAVMFNQPTDSVAQWGATIPGFAASLSAMAEGKFIMASGGFPLRVNGVTIGGIGVSGGNAAGRDDDIATAGVRALEAMAPSMSPMPSVPQPLPLQPPSTPMATAPGMQPQGQPYTQTLYTQEPIQHRREGNPSPTYRPTNSANPPQVDRPGDNS